ncbi:MAG: sigma-70 family RNA polymerase sigma factor [Sandaracinaceae bacterium]
MGDDAELLRAWRAGDATAGAALYDRTFPLVNRFFRCKVDDEIAVDLIQATFLAAVESLERFRGASSFRAFLLGIARHELLDHYRSKARDRSVPIDELTLEDLDPSPSSLLRHGREQRALLSALRSLPLELQLLVELHYWEGLTGPELSDALELPEGTVRSRLRRAREQLRSTVERAGEAMPRRELAATSFESWVESVRPSDAAGPHAP